MRMVRDSSPTAPRLPLVERSRRVGERVEDDVCAARLEERREQHLQKKEVRAGSQGGARLGRRGGAGRWAAHRRARPSPVKYGLIDS